MRAAIYRSVGGPDVIEVAEVPTPEPGLFEIRVRVQAASLNPADIAGWSGIFPGPPAGGYFGIGMDLAGVVDAAGPLTTWEPGTPVIGYIPGPVRPVRAQAEYAIVTAGAIAPAPAGVDPVHAATIPLNGLTASQSVELLGIQPGQTVLITGAGGAVGGYAVQLAKRRGATVIAIAPARDEEFLRGIGVDHFVPASDDPAGAVLEIAPGGVDAALDTTPLGGALVPALRDGGTFVRTTPELPAPERGIRYRVTHVGPDGAMLHTLSDLAAAGELALRVADTYPLADVAAAHARLAKGDFRGRIVLTVP